MLAALLVPIADRSTAHCMETRTERATNSARDRLAREPGWEGFETDRFTFPTEAPAGKSLARRGIEAGISVVVLLVADGEVRDVAADSDG